MASRARAAYIDRRPSPESTPWPPSTCPAPPIFPFLAALATPNNCLFYQGFISYRDPTGPEDVVRDGEFQYTVRDPDLLMVDGGRGQVGVVMAALEDAGLEQLPAACTGAPPTVAVTQPSGHLRR